jgi:hypothetical protein
MLDLSGRATGGAFHPTAEGHSMIAKALLVALKAGILGGSSAIGVAGRVLSRSCPEWWCSSAGATRSRSALPVAP